MATRMQDMTWMEYRDAVERGSCIIIPVGSIEQHGPHLPLDTDCVVASRLAERVAERTHAVVAAPIQFGYKSQAMSGGGQIFPGTTSLDGDTLIRLTRDILRELFRHGVRKVLLLSGHGENQFFLFEASDLALNGRRDAKVVVTGWWQVVPDALVHELFDGAFPGWDLEHAATVETALMMALDPARVRQDSIADAELVRVPPCTTFPQPAGLVPESGLLSKVNYVTPEMRERLVAIITTGLVRIVEDEFD